MNDGLKETHRQAIIALIAADPRVERAVLFGSRAMGTFSSASDVDIALFGDSLTLDDLASLAERISELTIPQQADLLLYHRVKSRELLTHIAQHGVEWYLRTSTNSSGTA